MILPGDLQSQKMRRFFWLLFGLTILTILGMQITGESLKTEAAHAGIVSFELVGTLSGSQSIVESWQGPAMTWVGINMGLDFLFLFLYASTIALACLILSDKMATNLGVLKILGKWLAVGILIAAGLDIIENISLILLLTGSENEFLPQLARWCAIPKFALVLLSLLYIVAGGLIDLMKKYDLAKGTHLE